MGRARFRTAVFAVAAGAGVFFASVDASADLRLHGASTLIKLVVEPGRPRIEQAVGQPLAIVTNGSGNGLKDLMAGRADVAMIAAPLEVEAVILNTIEPNSFDTAGLKVFPVGTTKLQVFVHPGNPIAKLAEDQIRDILTGTFTNWSQAGGADVPIVVVIERPLNGTRAFLQTGFLKGAEFAPHARIAQALGQVVQIVSQVPTAIGYGNSASIDPDRVKVMPGIALAQPMALVTRGQPDAVQAKLIAAVSEAAVASR